MFGAMRSVRLRSACRNAPSKPEAVSSRELSQISRTRRATCPSLVPASPLGRRVGYVASDEARQIFPETLQSHGADPLAQRKRVLSGVHDIEPVQVKIGER